MALGTGYDQQACYLARALEVVGERWTLLVLRDCFYGVRRFTDLREHLDVSRAVLADRLRVLVAAGVLEHSREAGQPAYVLTEAGQELWPVVFGLAKWGERHVDAPHPARSFRHADCGTEVDHRGECPRCHVVPGPADLVTAPGREHGADVPRRSDRVAVALREPHRMLTPVRA